MPMCRSAIGLYRDFTNRRHRIYRTYHIEFYNRPNTGPVVARSGSDTGELPSTGPVLADMITE